MEDEHLVENGLWLELRDSRRRFQTYMQQLVEKYDQPFEDDPLVHMSTLTYETSQGLRIWGGRLVKEGNKEQSQNPSVTVTDRVNGPKQAADGHKCPLNCTQVLGADSESTVVATSDKEDPFAYALKPAVPGSPLKNELRRKYLTQVDILLQDAEYLKGVEKRDGEDTFVILMPSLTSPVIPAPGCQGRVSADSLGDPEVLTSSSREWDPSHPCPADKTIAPRNNDLSLLGTSSDSYLSSWSFEASDICNATISDLYAGMLHSMSRLLSSKPSCIISTKTYISQNWNPRRRLPHKTRVQRSSRQRSAPSSKPGRETGVLGDCENVLHLARCKKGLKLETPFLEGSKLQIHRSSPAWKKFQVAPRKHSSVTYLDFDRMSHLNQEDRLKALTWLISPVKVVSKPRMLRGPAESWYREIDVKFNKLHQECCLASRKHPHLADPSTAWAVDLYRGSRSPGSPQGLKPHRLSLSDREKTKRLSETLQDLDKVPVRAGRLPTKGHPSSSPSKDSPAQRPGHSGKASGLFQGCNSGPIRKAASPSIAISAPWMSPRGYGWNRYSEIKEEFRKLYQKYCLMSPQQEKVPLQVRLSPRKAGAGVCNQTEFSLGKLKSPWDSTTDESSASLGTVHVATNPVFPTKRRKLSYPQVCGHQADSQDSSGSVNKTAPCPEEQVSPAGPSWEKNTTFRMEEESDFC